MPDYGHAAYDSLAWFYNRHWIGEYHEKLFFLIEKSLLPRLSEDAKLLDICCGTGHVAGFLSLKGYDVTGIDTSPEMIKHARENAPGCLFLVKDVRDFAFKGDFDAVLSTFESLNHVMELGELEKVFQNVFSSLKERGLFFFDLLSEEAYLSAWCGTAAYVEEDNACILRGGYEGKTQTAKSEITMFRLIVDKWQRDDLTLFQKFHPVEEVTAALQNVGFSEVKLYDAPDMGMKGDIGKGRKFFFAKR
jgi:SAM-dependent methyltransferase